LRQSPLRQTLTTTKPLRQNPHYDKPPLRQNTGGKNPHYNISSDENPYDKNPRVTKFQRQNPYPPVKCVHSAGVVIAKVLLQGGLLSVSCR